eukprot:TRINITY_DN45316_c0_g1_i1.p1 TRINITY_DN45316_c0_g1~~TRINITY_DN45316_c0_g1_i1.p1  ORF type:complete len:525 (+),score=28.95 TRINITY_DN45316_c0_g1_i1:51-1577(+)
MAAQAPFQQAAFGNQMPVQSLQNQGVQYPSSQTMPPSMQAPLVQPHAPYQITAQIQHQPAIHAPPSIPQSQAQMMMQNGDTSACGPFTVAQWQELEQQALIFKYLVAGAPVPLDLIARLRMSVASPFGIAGAQPLGIFGQSLWGPPPHVELEPFRCRRTDGKKWRCSREVVADQKYCEKHMHRGRNRARKVNEKGTPGSSLVDTAGEGTVDTATENGDATTGGACNSGTPMESVEADGRAASMGVMVDGSMAGVEGSAGGSDNSADGREGRSGAVAAEQAVSSKPATSAPPATAVTSGNNISPAQALGDVQAMAASATAGSTDSHPPPLALPPPVHAVNGESCTGQGDLPQADQQGTDAQPCTLGTQASGRAESLTNATEPSLKVGLAMEVENAAANISMEQGEKVCNNTLGADTQLKAPAVDQCYGPPKADGSTSHPSQEHEKGSSEGPLQLVSRPSPNCVLSSPFQQTDVGSGANSPGGLSPLGPVPASNPSQDAEPHASICDTMN